MLFSIEPGVENAGLVGYCYIKEGKVIIEMSSFLFSPLFLHQIFGYFFVFKIG